MHRKSADLNRLFWHMTNGCALAGAIAIAGAGISWLRDGLGVIETAAQSEELAATVEDTAGVVFVPAFR